MKSNLLFAIVATSVLLSACQKKDDAAAPAAMGPAPVPLCVSAPNSPGCVAATGSGLPTGSVQVSNENALIRMMEDNGSCGQRGKNIARVLIGRGLRCDAYLNGGVDMQIAQPVNNIYNVTVRVGGYGYSPSYVMVFPLTLITFTARSGFQLRATATNYQTLPGQLPPGYPGYAPNGTNGVSQGQLAPTGSGLTVISAFNAFGERSLAVELQYRGRNLGTAILTRL